MANDNADILLMYELLKTQSKIDGLAKSLLTPHTYAEYLKLERGRIHYRVSKVIEAHGASYSWLSQLQTLVDRDSDSLED